MTFISKIINLSPGASLWNLHKTELVNTLTYKMIGYYTQSWPASHNFIDLETEEVWGRINEMEELLIYRSQFSEKSHTEM